MSRAHPWRPGAGFVLVSVTLLGMIVFFAWGLDTPPLDEVWQIQMKIQLGEGRHLSKRELVLFQNALTRHPEIARNILEDRDYGIISAQEGGFVDIGYAYLIRATENSPTVLQMEISPGLELGGVHATVRTVSSEQQRILLPGKRIAVGVGPSASHPQLIEVTYGTNVNRKKLPPLRIALGPLDSEAVP